ncbi:MAG: tetratricopeptide repeat protein [Lewinellaceae bacterium]|nr:tetratricopeptide repeat protein [Lewinellaceae bacterium]
MAQKKKNPKQAEEVLVDIVEVRDQAQDFYSRYHTYILGGVIALVLVVGGYLAYNLLYKTPRQKEAVEQMAQAQKQFERDSFALALDNPGGGFAGFLGIIENYGGTEAANLANYYAGISYLHLGRFEAAISYLDDFSADGEVMPIMKAGALGDANAELNNLDKALSFYQKAVKLGDDDLLTPYYLKKVGMLQQRNGKTDEALKAFQRIKTDYPKSYEATEVDKYIAVLGGM